jgi:hypothetical protein
MEMLMSKDKPFPPVKGIIPIDELFGEDAEDTQLLQAMAIEARSYIEGFAWCNKIQSAYFGDGYGGIVAVFLFQIDPAHAEVDEWLWVVVGDLPSAYLVLDNASYPSEALEAYIEEMYEWVTLAKQGRASEEVIPVNAPATPEFATMLEGRLSFLRDTIVPAFCENEMPTG